jgi:hypothetical protein
MRKFTLALSTVLLLSSQASADKISDTFSEIEGTWCYSSATEHLDQSNSGKGYLTTIYTKPCKKNGRTDWVSIDKVVTLKGSEYTCAAVEGGDAGLVSTPYGNKGTSKKMVFSFKHRCTGEGYRWTQTTRFLITGKGELYVGVKK